MARYDDREHYEAALDAADQQRTDAVADSIRRSMGRTEVNEEALTEAARFMIVTHNPPPGKLSVHLMMVGQLAYQVMAWHIEEEER